MKLFRSDLKYSKWSFQTILQNSSSFDAMVIKLRKEARFWEHNGNRNDYIFAFDMSNLAH